MSLTSSPSPTVVPTWRDESNETGEANWREISDYNPPLAIEGIAPVITNVKVVDIFHLLKDNMI